MVLWSVLVRPSLSLTDAPLLARGIFSCVHLIWSFGTRAVNRAVNSAVDGAVPSSRSRNGSRSGGRSGPRSGSVECFGQGQQ